MTDSESTANVSVLVKRDADGQLDRAGDAAPISVHAEYCERRDEKPGETRTRHRAKFLYAVEDGAARLTKVKEIQGDDVSSTWTGFGFLRCAGAAERAVSNVEGVETVERAEATLGDHVRRGRAATAAENGRHGAGERRREAETV